MLTGVCDRSGLADLGLRDGDELVTIDGAPLSSTARLLTLSQGLQRRRRVVLGVRRSGAFWQLTVVLADDG